MYAYIVFVSKNYFLIKIRKCVKKNYFNLITWGILIQMILHFKSVFKQLDILYLMFKLFFLLNVIIYVEEKE